MKRGLGRTLSMQLLLAIAFTLVYTLVVGAFFQSSTQEARVNFHRLLADVALQKGNSTASLREVERLAMRLNLDLDVWILAENRKVLATNAPAADAAVLVQQLLTPTTNEAPLTPELVLSQSGWFAPAVTWLRFEGANQPD